MLELDARHSTCQDFPNSGSIQVLVDPSCHIPVLNMMPLLPDELLQSLHDLVPCRELQCQHLLTLLSGPSPSPLVIYGGEATGKTLTIAAVLKAIQIPCALLPSQECITTRHLLERAVFAVKKGLGDGAEEDAGDAGNGRCESISATVVRLQQLLEGRGQFLLVFDGIDRQREAVPTLLPALARLGEWASAPSLLPQDAR